MKNLVDFDISEVFKDKKFSGIGNVIDVKKSPNGNIFNAYKHNIQVEEIGKSAIKVTFNPGKINKDLLVPHKTPDHQAKSGTYEVKLPKKGEKVIEYGEPIGEVSQNINAGAHVHVHNIKSMRW